MLTLAYFTQYAEAKCFELFLKEGRVIAPSELENVERDECASSSLLAGVVMVCALGRI